MAILLPPLPFHFDELEPFISAETVSLHYQKHHGGYVNKLNELIKNSSYKNTDLEEIILTSWKSSDEIDKKIFNNASQTWNHSFYWKCLSTSPHQTPSPSFIKILAKNYGSKDVFTELFTQECNELFGSGWVWLVKDELNQSLEIVSTQNAESPLTLGLKPLLVCDIWEHAYYVDYKNERKNYTKNFWSLVNWEFVESQFFVDELPLHAIPLEKLPANKINQTSRNLNAH